MKVTRLVAVVLAATLLFAGCGGGSGSSGNGIEELSATEILTRVGDAAKAQSSVHLVGIGSADGTALEMDLKLAKGKGASGSMTLDGGKLQLVSDASKLYIKADKSFWTAQANAAAAALVADRWVSMPASEEGFGDLANYDAFVSQLLEPEGEVTKGTTATVQGRKAIGLVTSEGTLWVSTTGDPLPLRIDSEEGSLRLTDWGSAVAISVPSASDVLDISKLGG